MVSRIVLTGAAALVTVGSFATPVTVSAKGAFGGVGHAGAAFHSGTAAQGPFLRPHAPFFAPVHVRAHAIGLHRVVLRRDRFRGTPLWWWAGFDDSGPYAYFYPTNDASIADQSAPPAVAGGSASPRPRPITVYRPGCRTQAQTVPSELGGTRTVNITRCY